MTVLSWKALLPSSLLVVTTVSCTSPPLTETTVLIHRQYVLLECVCVLLVCASSVCF